MQSVRHRLHHNAAAPIPDQPVQLRRRKVRPEGRAYQVDPPQRLPRLAKTGTPTKQPGQKLILRHVFRSVPRRGIGRIADKVQPGHPEALLIHRVIVERITVRHAGRAEDGIVRLHAPAVAERQRKPPRRQHHLFAISALIVERPSHIKISRQKAGRCTHLTFLLRDILCTFFSDYRKNRRPSMRAGACLHFIFN